MLSSPTDLEQIDAAFVESFRRDWQRQRGDAPLRRIAIVDDDVTNIDADTELDPAIFGNVGIALGYGALDFHGAAHSIDRASKLDQNAITGGLDDAAAILSNLGINEFAS